ncbi:hypothetical protein ACHAXA_008907 [Cyclostephanos tholiformis]|uniref:Uncharacterized protein n=1 Tax=Cyclostephanos tholiformis TaxID=382380 RepID=A0ABD3RI74_9STRA
MKAAATRMVLLVALSFQPLQLCPCYYCRASPVDDANNFFEEEEYDDDFFPLIIDASNVEHGLHRALSNVYRRSGQYDDDDDGDDDDDHHHHHLPDEKFSLMGGSGRRELHESIVSRGGGGDTYTTEYKLKHDLDQARYLSKILVRSDVRMSRYFGSHVAPIDYNVGISSVYNRALHVTTSNKLDPGWRGMSNFLGDGLDWDAIQGDWFGEGRTMTAVDVPLIVSAPSSSSSSSSAQGVIVINGLLALRTLSILRDLLLRNTHWFQTKTPLEFGKYVGSYINDGLNDPIFLEIAKEIHKSMPRIMEGHDLRYIEWESGINLHADMAAVNVNVWLSADGADLREEGYGGGLVVYTARPPDDWTFESYNADTNHVIEKLHRPTDFANTERYRFRKGYKNGRINLTFLFGEMRTGMGGKDDSCSLTTTITTTAADR